MRLLIESLIQCAEFNFVSLQPQILLKFTNSVFQKMWTVATVDGCRMLPKHVLGVTQKKRTCLVIERGTVSFAVVLSTVCHHPVQEAFTFTPFHSKNVHHPAPKL